MTWHARRPSPLTLESLRSLTLEGLRSLTLEGLLPFVERLLNERGVDIEFACDLLHLVERRANRCTLRRVALQFRRATDHLLEFAPVERG